MMTAKVVSQTLAQRAEDIARYLLPNGTKEGNEWRAGSTNGEKGQSLGVHLTGEKAGLWSDFALGQSGDLLDLWSATRKITLSGAMKEAACYLGVPQIRFEAHKPANFVLPRIEIKPTVINSVVMNYLINERKLTIETISAFQIGEKGREIILPYLRNNEIIFVKYLSLDRPKGKKQIRVEANCEPSLFGWHLVPANTRKITICEGEIDAMTLYQYGVPALSVPFGGGTGNKHKWLEQEFDRLLVFDEIYLCFDQDTEGQAAVTELIDRLGSHRCRVVELPYKDPNACLQAGIEKEEIHKYFEQARTLDPVELKRANFFVDQVIEEFYPTDGIAKGISPPWEKAKGKILFRPEELSVWSGINGHGKSQLLGHLILNFMKANTRVCIASLELKPKRLLHRLTRQAAGLAEPTIGYIEKINDWYGDNLWIFDLVGTAKTKRLLEVFLYARQRYGIDIFIIDSFMKLDIAEDDYKAQKAFMEQLCDFKNQHNCQIHIVVHPRKGVDETQAPGKLDNKGSGAISDMADNCFCVWRNKKKEEIKKLKAQAHTLDAKQLKILEEPDSLWICDKQRNGDWEGKIGLWFDPKSLQYLSFEKQKPTQYVEFSTLI